MISDHKLTYRDLGLINYLEAWKLQEDQFNAIIDYKRSSGRTGHPGNLLLFCEHPNVYTLGKSGNENNLLVRPDFLEKIDATYYRTNRGGDITYHGPGQIVGYPVLDLEQFGLGIKKYIELLERSIIELLTGYGLNGSGLEGATGVWIGSEDPSTARKICAIGVRSGRHVTMHGFALNVNTNLEYFSYIHPCGFETKGVTSMEKELGEKQDIEKVKTDLRDIISRNLRSQLHQG